MRRLTPEDFNLKKVAGRKFWHVVYPDPHTGVTRRYSTGTNDHTAARREMNRFIADFLGAVEAEGPEEVTIAECLDYYIHDYLNRPKQNTPQIREYFGDLFPKQITERLCDNYMEKRRRDGATEWTIRAELLSVLRSAIRRCVKDNVCAGPAPEIKAPEMPEGRHRYLTEEQARRLIAACKVRHMAMFIHVALATAARRTAVCELTWDRVDFEGGIVDMREPSSPSKRRKRRLPVRMTDDLRRVLLEERERQRKEGYTSPFVVAPTKHASKPIGMINAGFNNTAKRAGLDWVTPHDLRRTAATWMAQDGVPMFEISRYLGHASVKTTERHYAVFHPDYHSKGVEALNRRSLLPVSGQGGRYSVPNTATDRAKMDSCGQKELVTDKVSL